MLLLRYKLFLLIAFSFLFVSFSKSAIYVLGDAEQISNDTKLIVIYKLKKVDNDVMAVKKLARSLMLTLDKPIKITSPLIYRVNGQVYSNLTIQGKNLLINNLKQTEINELYNHVKSKMKIENKRKGKSKENK